MVWISCTGKHPLSQFSSSLVSREEIVKNGWIKWSNSFLLITVIICSNFWASSSVANINQTFNNSAVIASKFFNCNIMSSQYWHLTWCNQSVKLLFLVSCSVFTDNNWSSKMMQQIISKVLAEFNIAVSVKIWKHFLSFAVGSLIWEENFSSSFNFLFKFFNLSLQNTSTFWLVFIMVFNEKRKSGVLVGQRSQSFFSVSISFDKMDPVFLELVEIF